MAQVPASRVASMVEKILAENDDVDFIGVTLQPMFYVVSFHTLTLDGLLVLRRRLTEHGGYSLPLVATDLGVDSQLHARSGFCGTEARLAVHLCTTVPAEKLREIGVL